jgi:hypothetical protein
MPVREGTGVPLYERCLYVAEGLLSLLGVKMDQKGQTKGNKIGKVGQWDSE